MSVLSVLVGRRASACRLAGLFTASALGVCLFAATASAAPVTVTASPPGFGAEFSPQVVNVNLGDTVTFLPSGVSNEQVRFVSQNSCTPGPGFPLSVMLGPGTTSVVTPGLAGTYYYYDVTGASQAGVPACNPAAITAVPLPPYAGEIVVAAPSNNGGGGTTTSPNVTNVTPGGASVTATVAVSPQFKSVTVSTGTATFANCTGGSSSGNTLGFPNGSCGTSQFTVNNNGTVPESIDVQGANAAPSDGGTAWSLIGSTTTPGQNQFQLRSGGEYLSATPAPDTTAGTLQPNGSAYESLGLTGPSLSSDPSTSFTTSATWTAL